MARPITPVVVRRETDHSHIEVMARSGIWYRWDMLSMPSTRVVLAACRGKGYSYPFPDGAFRWDLSKQAETQPTPQPTDGENTTDSEPKFQPDTKQDAPTNGDQQDDNPDSDNDNESDDKSEQQPKEGQEMMEDIVRRIADELDQQRADTASDTFVTNERLTEVLEAFTPTTAPDTDSRLYKVTAEVVVTRADTRDTLEGVFHSKFPELLRQVSLGNHCYLPGPAGTGKSHAAEAVATALGWRFSSLSLGPTTPESRLWGGMDANGNFFEPPFVRGARYAMENPDSGWVKCLDEMDNGHSGILATLNSAMANGWFTAPNGDHITLGDNFVVIGCANTFGTGPTAEFAGRNKLDPATLDRFVYIPWDTDRGVEAALVRRWLDDTAAAAWLDVWNTMRTNIEAHGLKIFASMRGCLRGAKMVAHGVSVDDAVMLNLGNKVPADQWAKINPL